MMPSTMMGQPMAGGTAQAPGGSVTFGAPPPDIAVMGGAAAVAPAPVFDAPPPQAMAMQPAAGFRSPRTPFSPRFPAGVQPSYNAPAMVGGPVGVTPQGTVPMVAGTPVATVQFGVGSSKIDASARRAIRDAAAQQKASGGILHVIGHASSRTKNLSPMRHQMVNFRVSVDRANAVVRELMRAGVPAGAIQVTAVSDTEPVYYEVMPAGEAGNRRAVIVLQN
jgi:outer membrane protein OmpA-like peptidoglycan-associated protein